jgi:putative intracellular protease/amidase
VRSIDQGLPGGQRGQRQRGFFLVGEVARLGHEGPGRRGHVLRVAPAGPWEGQHAEDLVAGLVDGHAHPGGFDRARDIPAEHERGLAEEQAGLAVRLVDRVHPGGADPDADLADAGPRHGRGAGLQDSAVMAEPTSPHRVAVLALDGVFPFELGIPLRVLGAAGGHYDVRVCSVDGAPVETNAGFAITPEHGPEILATADTVIIAPTHPSRLGPELSPAVAAALAQVRPGTRIASICTGAFVLAAAGLLDRRPGTTHWQSARLFRQWYPHLQLNEDVLFVDDGDILTSAGAASGVDLCLHLIRSELDFPSPRVGAVAPGRAAERAAAGCPGAHEPTHLRPPVPGRDRPAATQVDHRPATGTRPAAAGVNQPAGRPDRRRRRVRHRPFAPPAPER